jgi:cation diffusion facilitator CzcD-associated flavoprotein CzcO
METREKYCIIGAGPSGLTVAKNFRERGIDCDVLEREDDVGGNWYYGTAASSVTASTHLISSKRMTEYVDFPMPKEYPPYPSHRQALEYLRAYATHFELYPSIRCGAHVERIEPAGELWAVTSRSVSNADGNDSPQSETQLYRGVVVANGHHWDPLLPEIPGEFHGDILHARDYKTPDQLRGKRVLVIGAGNSGCDIAVEAAQNAEVALLSLRRGYHFLPKFVLGGPIDSGGERFHRWGFPLWLTRWVTGWLVQIALGQPQRYGLPKPDHRLFETHPIVNSQLLYFAGHGKIQIRPETERLCGDRVRFVDGREELVDLIICATGYQVSFPFLDRGLVFGDSGGPKLFLNAFHPQYDNFFVAGLIQPNSGLWGLVDWQAQLMAAFVAAQGNDPARADAFRRLKSQPQADLSGGIHFVRSERHRLEVEYFGYRQRLQRLLRTFPSPRKAPCPK